MIIVTGGAGFIGSNIIGALNARNIKDILVVDDLTNGYKFKNLVGLTISDYLDKDSFFEKLNSNNLKNITAVLHQGACSDTTQWNGKYMLENNYEFSKNLFLYCTQNKIPFIYASSAAIYGNNKIFKEELQYENPLNIYGYSKFLFDSYVRQNLAKIKSQVIGLRYFNVYGPKENHKAKMASVAFHLNNQIKETQKAKLFVGSDGFGNGEQKRDFIYVEDVANVNLWFLDHKEKSGIFNVGTGRAQTFNDVANAVIAWHKKGETEYIPFPENLATAYQSFTQADLASLRLAGCDIQFYTVEQGIKKYLDWLNK